MASRKASGDAHRYPAGESCRKPRRRSRFLLGESRSRIGGFIDDVGRSVRGRFHSDMTESEVFDGLFQVSRIDGHARGLGEIRIRSGGAVVKIPAPVVSSSRKLRGYQQRPSSSSERHVAVSDVRRDRGSGSVRIDRIRAVLAASGRRAPWSRVWCRGYRRTVLIAARQDRSVSFLPRIRRRSGSRPSRNLRRRHGSSGVHEGSCGTCRCRIAYETVYRARKSDGKISRNGDVSEAWDSRYLNVSAAPFSAVRGSFSRIRGSNDGQCGIRRRGVCLMILEKSRPTEFFEIPRDLEFRGIEFQFGKIGITCGIVRPRLVPIPSGECRTSFRKSHYRS